MINLIAMLVVCFLMLWGSPAWAHSGDHVMGTVIAIDAAHFDVKTPQGETVSIKLTDKTTYASKNMPPAPKPRVGDRVVIEAVKEGTGLRALGMEFSTPGQKFKP
jgi:hypothetical protein